MVRFATVAAVLALMAAPLVAQESTDELKKELDALRKEVDGLKAQQAQVESKEVPGSSKVDAGSMAPEGDSPIMTALKSTKLSGFVDTGYQVSFGNGLNGTTGSPGVMSTRVFDDRANSFYLNSVQLNIERLASKDMIVGYHFELAAGHDVGIYNAAGSEVGLQEGWLQILAPVGNGIDIRVGKQAYLGGFEVIESKDDFNYSRGLLFGFIQPFTQTGIRASYAVSDQLSATLGFSNSRNTTDQYADTDNQKDVDVQVAFKPTKDALVQATLTEGTETAATLAQATGGKFYIFDIVTSYTMDKLTVALNLDWASADKVLVVSSGKHRAPLSGFAAYGKYEWTDAMATALRFEYFSDGEGAFFFPHSGAGIPTGTDTGTGARIFELTFTQEMKVANQLILRVEVRTDNSNNHVMTRDTRDSRGDTTLGFEAIMPF